MKLEESGLTIRNLSAAGKAAQKVSCPPGKVSVIKAYSSSDQFLYNQALSGQGTSRVEVKLNDMEWQPIESLQIGFGEELPEGLNSIEYLKQVGIADNQIDALLAEYGLDKYCYLSCNNLPAPAARQLTLLAATKTPTKVLVLNDPFEPLSGRWRERFAELMIEDAKRSDRVTVVTSLSHIPEFWQKSHEVNLIELEGGPKKKVVLTGKVDLDQIAKEAALENSEFDRDKPEAALALLSSFGVPSKYLDRLAEISRFMRKYSVAFILVGLSLLFGVGALVMNYGIKASPIKIARPGMGSMEGETRGVGTKKSNPSDNGEQKTANPDSTIEKENFPIFALIPKVAGEDLTKAELWQLFPHAAAMLDLSSSFTKFVEQFDYTSRAAMISALDEMLANKIRSQEQSPIASTEEELTSIDNEFEENIEPLSENKLFDDQPSE